MESLWIFLAFVAVFVAAARLKPALLGPMWLRAVVWVAMVVVGLVIVARLWGTVEAYFAYLAAAIVVSALVDRALPPNRADRA